MRNKYLRKEVQPIGNNPVCLTSPKEEVRHTKDPQLWYFCGTSVVLEVLP